jgi:pyruvate dehydrogenase E2 component (dihydrolipoamide acetyltransferase)
MPTEVIMPRLGWDMKVGSVAEWVKRDGEPVQLGEVICMIAGDKATTELEAPESGILRIPPGAGGEGEEVSVGTVLAYVLAAGEDIPAEAASPRSGPAGVSAGENIPVGSAIGVAPRTGEAFAVTTPSDDATRGERVQAVADSEPTEVGGNGHAARRIVASPRARRAAAALGIDWHTLVGSGRGGRILERDVGAGATARPQGVPPRVAADDTPAPASQVAVPLQGIRRVTAERMALSAQTVAAVTLTTEADATALVRLREQALAEKAGTGEVPGYSDFMIKVVALALAEHPALNASLTEQGIVQHAQANVAIAVDTPSGLLAPVVRDAGGRSVASIATESRRLIEAARAGSSQAVDLAGATFTITNLGMFDIDAFTPMVNLPQCAILGLGRIMPKPVVVDEATEQVAVRRMLSLSLTFDHRLVDGAPAARFLQRIKHFVEHPTLWLFR